MIPFSPPYINDNVIKEVVDSLKSGWITTGPKVKELEHEIGKLVGLPNVLCVNSWTSGAIMMLRWLGLEKGDEVIIPSYTYSATALAVIHAGGVPVMVDVHDDFNINIDAIQNAITPRTKAVMSVDFAGYPCDYSAIKQLLSSEKVISHFKPTSEIQKKLGRILFISDAAHSLGAVYKNKGIGHFCDISIFSLHAVKNITTAEGGAIIINMPEPFNNEDLYGELRSMTLNCQTKDAFSKSQGGNWKYDITGLGMKINMADVNAAIGLAQIKEYPELLKRRKSIFQKYNTEFKKLDWAIEPPMSSNNKESSYHLYPLRIKNINESQRDDIISLISAQQIAVNVHFIPLPLLSYFKGLGYLIKDHPKAYDNYVSEISLPIYPQLLDESIDLIIKTTIDCYEQVISTVSKTV
ncbi:dTDP-4-amino-4,6-dideoxygalactose transaminase [Maribacter sedimenticola]|uniref:dTDP-4-amino-4,6-dideoxygalactose transaminase n=1 Tax=Maribacter sedimenticola TaxID=228956 RepID=A0ABY1SJX4_9FLAO|nr:DegT/DnrJ/EryC1/StrS family aminotransferase [Maribacter sedimenticola]SNR67084.1 dTDP-4-amino-4,6-dideoxygalactose transaminase [Maribacter sedimenticola]